MSTMLLAVICISFCGLVMGQSNGSTDKQELAAQELLQRMYKLRLLPGPYYTGIESRLAPSGETYPGSRVSGFEDSSNNNGSIGQPEYCFMDVDESPVICDENHHCCGYGRMDRKCCPNLSAGAIFGIVSSVVFIAIFFVSIVLGCCIWFDCTLVVRPRDRKKASMSSVTQSSGISEDFNKLETGFNNVDKDRRVASLKEDLLSKTDEQTNYEYRGDNAQANHLLLALPLMNDSKI